MSPAQIKIQMDEMPHPLAPCVVAPLVQSPDKIPCSGRYWRLLLHVTTAGVLVERHVPCVCAAHALVVAAQQAGEILGADELRRGAAAAGLGREH